MARFQLEPRGFEEQSASLTYRHQHTCTFCLTGIYFWSNSMTDFLQKENLVKNLLLLQSVSTEQMPFLTLNSVKAPEGSANNEYHAISFLSYQLLTSVPIFHTNDT